MHPPAMNDRRELTLLFEPGKGAGRTRKPVAVFDGGRDKYETEDWQGLGRQDE